MVQEDALVARAVLAHAQRGVALRTISICISMSIREAHQ